MNRRRFLSTTALGALAAAALGASARALSVQSCDGDVVDKICSELARHDNLLIELKAQLAQQNLTNDQRRAILAAAICPFCGQPLLG